VVIGSSKKITDLSPGTYSVLASVGGCSVSRDVTIEYITLTNPSPIVVAFQVTAPTLSTSGKIFLDITGGYPPYSIWWKNSSDIVIATNLTTLQVPANTTVSITVVDSCQEKEYNYTMGDVEPCDAGTRLDAVLGCVSCLPGTFSKIQNVLECTVCSPGSWNNISGATNCTECPANTYSAGGSDPCSGCDINFGSDAVSGICSPCAPGMDRSSDESECNSCEAGQFRCDIDELCEPCPKGSFSGSGMSVCELCDPGTFQNQTGQAGCLGCPPNSYSAAGALECSPCPAGTFAPPYSTVLIACAVTLSNGNSF